jgi:hypothetical protein
MKREIEILQNTLDVLKGKLLTATGEKEELLLSAIGSCKNCIHWLNRLESLENKEEKQ